MEGNFKFPSRHKMILGGISVLGILFIIIGILLSHHHTSHRIWGSFLQSSWLFLGLGLSGAVIIAIKYLAEAGWYIVLKRIMEAMSAYIPIGAALFAIPFLVYLFVDHHNIYHWTHDNLDALLQGKTPYLNIPFFAIRMVLILVVWILFSYLLRKFSRKEDEIGGLTYYNKSYRTAAGFLPLFAVSISFGSWDWFMSLEPHWYSTIYGVYVFAGIFVGGWTLTALFAIYFQNQGYMEEVNEHHFHDIGKFMFGMSIFWMYIWVSQFLLIWYANIPEETMYYFIRINGPWAILFFANIILNWAIPMLALMTNTAKKSKKVLVAVGTIMLIGRWVDLYLLIMPGAKGSNSLPTIGFIEIGFTLLLGGIFFYVILHAFTKAAPVPKNHPYVGESKHHEIAV